jgi:hypothetical protein
VLEAVLEDMPVITHGYLLLLLKMEMSPRLLPAALQAQIVVL